MDVEYKMKLPSVEEFKDLHPGCGLPELPMGRIEEYLSTLEKDFEEKFVSMYEQRCVLFIHYMECSINLRSYQIFIMKIGKS